MKVNLVKTMNGERLLGFNGCQRLLKEYIQGHQMGFVQALQSFLSLSLLRKLATNPPGQGKLVGHPVGERKNECDRGDSLVFIVKKAFTRRNVETSIESICIYR